MSHDPIVIVSFARTPIGNLLGELKNFSATDLGTAVIRTLHEKVNLSPDQVDEVIMGCVLPAGLGQAPARQAALGAGISHNTPCTTINKVCGSGMKAVMFAHDGLLLGHTKVAIAGGMESMTNAPYLLLKGRQGYRLGASTLYDHMMLDGLEDAYDKGKPMGHFAESCVKDYHFTRKELDDYAFSSFERAIKATKDKAFLNEIVPLVEKTKTGERIIETDEHPFSVNPEKIPNLKPAFSKDGAITAGNASSIADGAAALMLMSLSEATKRGIKPIAKIIATASSARLPAEFTIAPIDVIKSVLKKADWQVGDVDLFELNEAFAVVVLAAMKSLNIPHEKINVHGGGIALGHPIGASGARILVSLISALELRKLKKGVASLCIGGGEATAVAIEMMD